MGPTNRHRVALRLRLCLDAHLKSLALSHAATGGERFSGLAARFRAACAAGTNAPLFFVRDLSEVLTCRQGRSAFARPAYLPDDIDTSGYKAFLERIARDRRLLDAGSWGVSDPAAGVICARLLDGLEFDEKYRVPGGPPAVDFERLLDRELTAADPAAVWRTASPSRRPDHRRLLSPRSMARIEENLKGLDRDELMFLHRFGPRSFSGPDPRDMLDWFNLTGLPEGAKTAVSQMLKFLPRVCETRAGGGAQAYPMGGFEGLTKKGTLDSILPSELAYPKDYLLHRLLNQEALYYGREAEREKGRELAYIVTQTGLDMLGDPDVAARGLTLALARAMEGRGRDVLQSFAAQRLEKPRPLRKPADLHRVLYYRDRSVSDVVSILGEVAARIKSWSGKYRTVRVFWVLGAFWDADEAELHGKLYRELGRTAEHFAWFVGVGGDGEAGDGEAPAAAKLFKRHRWVDARVVWKGAEQAREVDVSELKRRAGKQARPRYSLRSEPMVVEQENFKEVFGLDEKRRPLEYVENDFEDRGDVVMDRATGIMWQKSGSDGSLTYQKAREYVQVMNRDGFAGYSDWRLPTIPELASLLTPEKNEQGLFIDPVFDQEQWWCWSSDERSAGGGAWVVYFYFGFVYWNDPFYDHYVRVCRS